MPFHEKYNASEWVDDDNDDNPPEMSHVRGKGTDQAWVILQYAVLPKYIFRLYFLITQLIITTDVVHVIVLPF